MKNATHKQSSSISARRFAHALTVALVLLIGIGLSLGMFAILRTMEQERLRAMFKTRASERMHATKRALVYPLDIMRDLRSFYVGSKAVERSQFHDYLADTLANVPFLTGAVWVPRVPAADRAAIEMQAQTDGLNDFRILAEQEPGPLAAAPSPAEYYPIYYAEPATRMRPLLGRDLGGNAAFRAVMDRACDSGLVIMWSHLYLGVADACDSDSLVLEAVYRNGVPHTTIVERRQNLLGFIMAVINVEELMERSLMSFAPAGVDVALFNGDQPILSQLVYRHISRVKPGGMPQAPVMLTPIQDTCSFSLGENTWTIVSCPTPSFLRQETRRDSWLVLFGGLIVTAFVAVFARQSSRRQSVIEKVVVERSAELTTANVVLQKEIARREQAEAERRESDQKFRTLFEASSDAIMTLEPPAWRFTSGNPATVKMFRTKDEAQFTAKCPWEFSPQSQSDGTRSDDKAKAMILKAMQEGSHFFEWDHMRLDGEVFPATVLLTRVAVGGKVFLQATVRDITEVREAQETLRRSEEEYRSLFENMRDGFAYCEMLFENGRPQDFTYIRVNDAFERLTGLKDVVGKRVTEVIPGIRESNPELFEVYGRVALTGKPESLETCLQEIGWLSISVYSPKKRHFVAVFENITGRKEAEEEIQQSAEVQSVLNGLLGLSWDDLTTEELLQQAIDHMTALPWFVSSRGVIFLADDKQEMLTLAAQRGVPAPLLTACAHVPFGKCICGKAALSGQIEFADHVDARHEITFDGMRPHGHFGVPILSSGRVLGVINLYVQEGHQRGRKEEDFLRAAAAVLAGIIERRRMEEERRRSEERLRLQTALLKNVLSHIPHFVFWKDRNSVYLGCNEVFAQSAGVEDPDDIVGKTDYDLVWKKEADSYRQCDRQVMDTGEPLLNFEEPQTREDGRQIILLTSKVPLRDAAGHVTGLLGVYADITERKRAEQELAAAAAQWNATFNSIADLVSVQDANHRLVRVNKAYAETFRASPEQLAGRPCYETVHGTRTPWPACPCRTVFETNKPARVEIFEPSLGVYLEVSVSPLFGPNGEVAGCVHVAKNITERKCADQKQAELLEQLAGINQELKDFAYVVSHDLKAPLRAIRNLADWLSADCQDQLDSQGKENLRLLGSRVDRMQNLIDGVLQYSRVGRTEQAMVPVDLARVVPEIIENLAAPAHISIRIESDLPVVEANATRITQVFQNLLSNALKYSDKPEGRIAVACVEEGGFWKFSISDNGPGIERKDFERIFKLFQTLGRRADNESTGVGLTITKKIVEMYGGKIWVESEVGQGSTFFFTFPKSRANVANETLQTCAAG